MTTTSAGRPLTPGHRSCWLSACGAGRVHGSPEKVIANQSVIPYCLCTHTLEQASVYHSHRPSLVFLYCLQPAGGVLDRPRIRDLAANSCPLTTTAAAQDPGGFASSVCQPSAACPWALRVSGFHLVGATQRLDGQFLAPSKNYLFAASAF